MTVVKGRFLDVDIANDGSALKIRMRDGSTENAARMNVPDFLEFATRVMEAGAAIKMAESVHQGANQRFGSVPKVLMVEDCNAAIPEGGEAGPLLLEVTYSKGQRVTLSLLPHYIGFLEAAIQRLKSQSKGHEVH